jgi:hypothetical protein
MLLYTHVLCKASSSVYGCNRSTNYDGRIIQAKDSTVVGRFAKQKKGDSFIWWNNFRFASGTISSLILA